MSGTDQIDERASGATSEPLRRNRDFVLLWSANVGSVLGANISSLAYPLIALDLTGSAVQAGLIGSATLITHIVFRLPAGALVDRWNRRRTMLACDLLRAGLLLAVVAGLLSGRLTFWMLLGAAVISGTCAVFFHPAQMSALRRIVPTGRLPQAFALNEARDQVATIAGPPLGGLLYGLGQAVPFAGQLLAYLCSFLAILAIRTPMDVQEREEERGSLLQDIVEGLRWTWAQRLLRVMLLAAAGVNLVFSALTFGVIVIVEQGGATSAEVGLMLGVSGVGGLLGALTAPRLLRFSPVVVILGVFWVSAALVPLMAISPTIAVIAPALAAMLFLMPAANVILGSYQVAVTPDRLQGRVISSLALIGSLAGPVGPVAAGSIIERWGPAAALSAIGVVMLIVAAGTTASRTIRHMPSLADAARATGETPDDAGRGEIRDVPPG
ncbi:MFS transporter [Streptosporangium lutulentum]|uniref:MFS family arabinose efflux permease n=1 Tax=Streptosporangium lutulentum TaxID=1461250 RepID=A0ABT9QNJ7_9ACTN|nr:MFS transporter [Streptosporangium lutulentum]MDP9847833.1 putative MFS family arabinose efflux permease [Streptosporangium lutulentum]